MILLGHVNLLTIPRTPAPTTVGTAGGRQAVTVTVNRGGGGGAVTQTNIVYSTTHMSGTVWVVYVLFFFPCHSCPVSSLTPMTELRHEPRPSQFVFPPRRDPVTENARPAVQRSLGHYKAGAASRLPPLTPIYNDPRLTCLLHTLSSSSYPSLGHPASNPLASQANNLQHDFERGKRNGLLEGGRLVRRLIRSGSCVLSSPYPSTTPLSLRTVRSARLRPFTASIRTSVHLKRCFLPGIEAWS